MSEMSMMPHGLGFEKSILSTLLKQPEPYVGRAKAEGLTAEHFYLPAHQLLFRRIMATPIEELELTSFVEDLHSRGELDDVGGRSAIADIYTYAPNNSHWSLHLGKLRESMALRRSIHSATSILEESYGHTDPATVRQLLSKATESVSEALQSKSRLWTGESAVAALRERIKEAEESKDGTVGTPTGIFPVDHVTGGLAAGDLWVISAETSGGKTALMLQIAAAFCAAKKRTFIDSLEIQKEKVVGRLATTHAGTPYRAITRPKMVSDEDRARVSESLSQVATWNLTIDDEGARTVEEIGGMAEMARDMMGGLDLIVVDYLQRVRATNSRKNETREQEVSHISSSLKSLAMRLQIPVLTASQLNDNGKLRESRAIGQDADVVLRIGDEGIQTMKVRDAERNQMLPVFFDGATQQFRHDPSKAMP